MKIEADGAQDDVVVRIWQPEPFTVANGPDQGFRSKFEIAGLPENISSYAPGVDSMQAVVSALAAMHKYLSPYKDSLTWLDMPYEETTLVISMQDAGRRRRIEDILDEEEYAITRRLASLERTKEERKAHLQSRAGATD